MMEYLEKKDIYKTILQLFINNNCYCLAINFICVLFILHI